MRRIIASLLLLAGTLHAQVLINDFTMSGSPFFVGTANSSATGQVGQIDIGFFTINDANHNGQINAYSSGWGSPAWALPGGYTSGSGSDLDLSGVDGFLVSLRGEGGNTASQIYLSLVTTLDRQYDAAINLNSLTTSSFTDLYIPLSSFIGSGGALSYTPGLKLMSLSILGDYRDFNYPAPTYNFSVDSVRAVPEPSAVSLLAAGLAGLIALRRRKQS